MIPSDKRLIVVLGMHRSGTSTVTRALNVLGVSLGDRLMPPIDGNNAKGFFEDIDFNALNIEMLQALGSDWHCLTPIESSDVETLNKGGFFLRAVTLLRQKTEAVPIFGFKDPRVAKLLPFWQRVFVHCKFNTGYVIAVRHPLSVAKSLAERDGFGHEKSYMLWLGHVLTSLVYTEKDRRVLVDYDRFLHAPKKTLELIAKRFDLLIDPLALQQYQSEFLDEGLRHSVYAVNDLAEDQCCPPLVQELYVELLKASRNTRHIDSHAFRACTALWIDEFERNKLTLRWIDNLYAQVDRLDQSINEYYRNNINLITKVLAQDQSVFQKTFDSEWYLKTYPDIAAAEIHPYQHYIRYGLAERRLPAADLAAFIRDGLLAHLQELNAQNEEARKHIAGNNTQLEQLALARQQIEALLIELAHREKAHSQQLQEIQRAHEQQEKEQSRKHAEREQALLEQLALAVQRIESGLIELAQREKAHSQQLYEAQQAHEKKEREQVRKHEEREQVLSAHLHAKQKELHNSMFELNAMRATYSWRVTAPLRNVISLGKRMKKKILGPFISSSPEDQQSDVVQPSLIQTDLNRNIGFNMTLMRNGLAAASLVELLSYNDKRFIQCAYHTLLGRAPDPEGMCFYLTRLRAGISKVEILAQLRSGAEGKSRPVDIVGLDDAIKRHKWLRMPLLGALLRLAGVRVLGSDKLSHFDAGWYLAQNPDVAASGIDPLEHYLKYGKAEGRQPAYNPVSTCSTFFVLDDIKDNSVRLPKDVAVHAHIYYSDTAPEIRAYLANIPVKFHCYVTTDTPEKAKFIEDALSDMNNILALDIRVVENRGRDIAPMLVALGAELARHEVVLHIHTKRSPHNLALRGWRRYLMMSLLGNAQIVTAILHQFAQDTRLGILFPQIYHPVIPFMRIGGNARNMAALLSRADSDNELKDIHPADFPAGAMFWFRGKAIEPFVRMQLTSLDFDDEAGQSDSTLAHAIERLFPYFSGKQGLYYQSYLPKKLSSSQPGAAPLSLLNDFWAQGIVICPIIIFDHNIGGGANRYSRELINDILAGGNSIIRIYHADENWFVEWIGVDDGLIFVATSEEEMFDTLARVGSKGIVVNSIYGYPDVDGITLRIVGLAQLLNTTVDYKVHDFYSICPSQHLLDFSERYCQIPKNHSECNACLKKNPAAYWASSRPVGITEWRRSFTRFFGAANVISVFDQSTIEILRKVFQLEDHKIKITPHGDDYFKCNNLAALSGQPHIGVLGTLTLVKGAGVVNALAEHIEKQGVGISITVVGRSVVPTAPGIKVVGPYENENLPEIVRREGINVILMPTIVPETFSYTISEAMKMGLPIVAFDIGAQGGRVKQYGLGKVVPLGSSPISILSAIQSVLITAKE